MSRLVINRNSGASDEYGTFLPISRLIQGNVIEGMQVAAQGSPNMTVQVSPGTCLVPTGTYPTSYSYHCAIDTTGGETVTIATASGSNPRIDYIVAYVDKSVTPSSGTPNNPNNMFKLADVQGTPAASPVVPTVSQIQTTIGASNPYIILAQVLVGTSVTQITNANITDQRVLATTAGSSNGWQNLSGTLTYAGNNGNKEFLLNTSLNLTGTLQPGDKLSVVRNTTPPTQCMSFASASNQYATNATPSGITFTGAFTCDAWVKLTSYGAAGVISRTDNSTGGFLLYLTNSGQVEIGYLGSSNETAFASYQSIPLNQWVHIAGVVSSTSSKTLQGIYINGTSVPAYTVVSNATSLTQTGNLSIGALGAGISGTFMNGSISEARVWSAAQTQAQIQANMAKNLTGSETNLVGLWQGGGNFSDSTSNGNTLIAQSGASATQADNPYNATEYGFITTVSSTQITVFTGNSNTIPNMTLNNAQYSIDKAPYGFNTDRGNWTLITAKLIQENIPIGSLNQWTNSNHVLSVPTGAWRLSHEGNYNQNNSTAGSIQIIFSLLQAGASGEDAFTQLQIIAAVTATDWHTYVGERSTYIKLSSQKTYTMQAFSANGSGTVTAQLRGDISACIIRAECAYA